MSFFLLAAYIFGFFSTIVASLDDGFDVGESCANASIFPVYWIVRFLA